MSGIARLLDLARLMQVRVLFFGQLKDATGVASDQFDAPGAASLDTVWEHYAARFPRLAAHKPHVRAARNHEFTAFDTAIHAGDEIAFLPPVSGGSSPASSAEAEQSYVALTRQPIDPRALVRRVQRPADGAIATFEGIVRNHSQGRPTRFLEYECYEPMALKLMQALRLDLKAKYAIGEAAIAHRLGRLEIGEASVVIAVSAPHRKPAFEACFEGINRLKSTIPIWKKEHFVDGETWVEGEWDKNAPSF